MKIKKKLLLFTTLNQESSDAWEVMHFTLLAVETVARLNKQAKSCVVAYAVINPC